MQYGHNVQTINKRLEEVRNQKNPQKVNERYDRSIRATGIIRRIYGLGRIVIPKEIRRTLRIRESDPSLIVSARWRLFCFGIAALGKRCENT